MQHSAKPARVFTPQLNLLANERKEGFSNTRAANKLALQKHTADTKAKGTLESNSALTAIVSDVAERVFAVARHVAAAVAAWRETQTLQRAEMSETKLRSRWTNRFPRDRACCLGSQSAPQSTECSRCADPRPRNAKKTRVQKDVTKQQQQNVR